MNDWDMKGRMPIQYRRVMGFRDEVLRDVVYGQVMFQASYAWSAVPVPLADSLSLPKVPIAAGEVWGRTWESGYFRLEARVPADWAGCTLAADLDFGGEALLYDDTGLPLNGVTSGSAFAPHYNKSIHFLKGPWKGGESVVLFVEAAANPLVGLDSIPATKRPEGDGRIGSWTSRVNKINLVPWDEEVWQLWLDIDWLMGLWEELPRDTVQSARILRAVFEASVLYRNDRSQARLAREKLKPEMARPAVSSALGTVVVGHAHIDTAWLWRVAETRRKVVRTFANQLNLIDRYPGYVFGASAPLHYWWLKEDQPRLFDQVKAAVAAGRWELQGGMWLEPDCNLASGEALVRHLLWGQRFWMQEFGTTVRTCWLPDVFGYPASLPQLLKKAGIDWFLTQKLSWSKMTEFRHHTFHWAGIDGSSVLTHFPPEANYTSFASPANLIKAQKQFKEKDRIDEFLTLIGVGDGGGGPKEEFVEHVLRAANMEGLPKASMGTSEAFFQRLEAKAGDLETWFGELYLEYHRGTFTTQASVKKNNRQLETLLWTLEALATTLPADRYPSHPFREALGLLLKNQFHDILPGSSIREVYEDASEDYAQAFALLEGVKTDLARDLLIPATDNLVLYNGLSCSWSGFAVLPKALDGRALFLEDGTAVAVQRVDGRWLAKVTVPPLGFLTLTVGTPAAVDLETRPELTLENDLVRYRFNPQGHLVEAWDKEEGRNLLRSGEVGNRLSLYDDTPHNWDAWEIDYYYKEPSPVLARPVNRGLVESGPLAQTLTLELIIGSSHLRQSITLPQGGRGLSLRTRVDWKEERKMLRTAFPLDSVATSATCEIQFGFVRRPTHGNTDTDFAQFEVCAHRWVDISDHRSGVALLNDSKYGHSVMDNSLELTLLRSPLYPDPLADVGSHEFEYVFLPHPGSLEGSEIPEEAARLNAPPLVFEGYGTGSAALPVLLTAHNPLPSGVVLTALKKAEEGTDLVVRLAETKGLRSACRLESRRGEGVWTEANLLEVPLEGETGRPGPLELTFQPFEVRTFLLSLGK